MATNHTTNYQLNLWEAQDTFLRTEFNENSQKLDAALKAEADARAAGEAALQTAVAAKADASTVTALTQTVNGKAEASTVTALTQTVNGKADTSSVTALAGQVTALAAKYGPDNLPWVTGSYTGNGSKQGDTKEITLGFRPTLLIVAGDYACYGFGVTHNGTSRSFGTATHNFSMQPIGDALTLTDTGFQVKRTNNDDNSMNRSGYFFVYFALR